MFTEKLEDGMRPEGQGPIEWGVRRAGRSSTEKGGSGRDVIKREHHLQDQVSLQPVLL